MIVESGWIGMVEPLVYETAPIGETVGPFTYVIPADFNRKRLAALSIDDPSLFVAGDGTTYAEPSLLCGQHSWVMRQRFSWVGSVHAKCDIAYLRPVPLGASIHVTGSVAGKYERRGGRYVIFSLESVDDGGAPLCRVENAMLLNFREVSAARRQDGTAASEPDPGPPPDDNPSPALGLSFGPKMLRRDDILRFFQAEEDVYGRHPSIHNDMGIARVAGLADIIAPGRYSIALLNCLFARLYGTRWMAGARYSVAFRRNLLPGVVVRAEAAGHVPNDTTTDVPRILLDVVSRNPDTGATLLSGTAILPDACRHPPG